MSYILATNFSPDLIVGEFAKKYGQTYLGIRDESYCSRVNFGSGKVYCCELQVANKKGCTEVWDSGIKLVGEIESSYILLTNASLKFVQNCADYFSHQILFMGDFFAKEQQPNYWISPPNNTPVKSAAKEMEATIINSYRKSNIERFAKAVIPQAAVVFAVWSKDANSL